MEISDSVHLAGISVRGRTYRDDVVSNDQLFETCYNLGGLNEKNNSTIILFFTIN